MFLIIHDAIMEADLIILSIPVGSMKTVASLISSSLKDGAVVTDTGSTKSSVISVSPFIPKMFLYHLTLLQVQNILDLNRDLVHYLKIDTG